MRVFFILWRCFSLSCLALCLPTFLLGTGCAPSSDSKSQQLPVEDMMEGVTPFELSILFPVIDHPDLLAQLPKIDDHPNPSLYAPGKTAIAEDSVSFVPLSVRQKMDQILLADEEQRTRENFVYGGQGFSTIVEQTFYQRPADFQLVSLRLDPCAPSVPQAPLKNRCFQEIRLVFQRLEVIGLEVKGLDHNIHAIYRLKYDEFKDIIRELTELQRATQGNYRHLPLGPHPVIKIQGAEGHYFKTILGLIHRYVRRSRLISVAGLGDTNASRQGHWPMFMLNIDGTNLSPMLLPHVSLEAGESPKWVQRMDGNQARLAAPSPLPDLKDRFHVLDSTNKRTMTAQDRLQLYQNTQRVENPIRHDTTTLDCASCHTATQERFVLEEQANRLAETLKNADERYVSTSWNLTNTISNNSDQTATQMFSLFLWDYRVTQRTINESALATDRVNQDKFWNNDQRAP